MREHGLPKTVRLNSTSRRENDSHHEDPNNRYGQRRGPVGRSSAECCSCWPGAPWGRITKPPRWRRSPTPGRMPRPRTSPTPIPSSSSWWTAFGRHPAGRSDRPGRGGQSGRRPRPSAGSAKRGPTTRSPAATTGPRFGLDGVLDPDRSRGEHASGSHCRWRSQSREQLGIRSGRQLGTRCLRPGAPCPRSDRRAGRGLDRGLPGRAGVPVRGSRRRPTPRSGPSRCGSSSP